MNHGALGVERWMGLPQINHGVSLQLKLVGGSNKTYYSAVLLLILGSTDC